MKYFWRIAYAALMLLNLYWALNDPIIFEGYNLHALVVALGIIVYAAVDMMDAD